MNGSKPQNDPPRLIEEGGDVGELLRAADDEYGVRLDERSAFRRLTQRRQRERALRRGGLVAGGVLAVAALGITELTRREAAPTATAEVFPMRSAARPTPEPSAIPTLPTEPTVSDAISSQKPADEPPRKGVRVAERKSAEPAPAAPACSELPSAKTTAPGARIPCLRSLAQGSGLTAEAAAFELARLTAVHSGKREAALDLLDEHRSRFPSSALRGEVDELRVRLLYELGRNQEALQVSESVLAAPWGRVLASKLHLLRGIIYEDRLGNPARAVTEYVALVGEAGAEGDDAEFRRARCLERLGRTDEAARAYARYLGRPDARRVTEARARSVALGPPSVDGPAETTDHPAGPGGPVPSSPSATHAK